MDRTVENPIEIKVKYSRVAIIEAHPSIHVCNNCHREGDPGLEMDTSGEEYGPVYVCFNCIDKLKAMVI